MSNLQTRLLSAIVFAIVIIGSILLGQQFFFITFGFVLLICHFEFLKITCTYSKTQNYIFAIVNTLPYLLFGLGQLGFISISAPIEIQLFLLFLFYAFVGIFQFQKTSFTNIISSGFASIYLTMPFIFALKLSQWEGHYSGIIILSVIVMNWANDTFAYLVGRKIGKTPLAKNISPNKTIEGSLGGVVGTILVGIILSQYLGVLNLKDMLIIGALVAIFGSAGDLFESILKRYFGIKDSGKIMPGHGGLLDRFDSFFFSISIVYIYLVLMN